MSSAVYYFPETEKASVAKKFAQIPEIPKIDESTLKIKETPKIDELTPKIKDNPKISGCSHAICYFPELDDNFEVITDPWSTDAVNADVSRQAIASLRHNIARELVLNEAYTEAIASLENLSAEKSELASLVETIITATITATVKEIRATPQTIQLDYPKSSWFPLINNPNQSSPLSQNSAPKYAPAKPSYEQEHQQKLLKIGQLLKKTREKQSISRNQLNHTTHILTHHIEAIEEGKLDRLPEDLYVRGFVRHLGNALKLDGNALANALPTQNNHPPVSIKTGFAEHTWASEATRYIGYGTLIAGAVSGLSWSLQQAHTESISLQSPSTVDQQQDARQEAQVVRNSVKLAPPEIMTTPQ